MSQYDISNEGEKSRADIDRLIEKTLEGGSGALPSMSGGVLKRHWERTGRTETEKARWLQAGGTVDGFNAHEAKTRSKASTMSTLTSGPVASDCPTQQSGGGESKNSGALAYTVYDT